ncbi:MAG: hypothetical protein E7358_05475 [Clostridiales bacterium]|nr:hypothetical protein [Clostridiales bacterium]
MEETILNKNNINSVKNRAQVITDNAKEQCKAEIERLKLFNARWNSYVNKIVKEYPSDETRKLVALSQMITEIIMREESFEYTPLDKIEDIYKIIGDGSDEKFDMTKTLFGESENGFNMEDVLNPKEELDLMSLCRELGATD